MTKTHRTMLSHIRNARGLTQDQVAGHIGVSKATYSSWETGRCELGAERIVALCRLFDCSPNDILGMGHPDERFSPLSGEDEELLELFHAQPPTVREHFLGLMRYTAKKRRGH